MKAIFALVVLLSLCVAPTLSSYGAYVSAQWDHWLSANSIGIENLGYANTQYWGAPGVAATKSVIDAYVYQTNGSGQEICSDSHSDGPAQRDTGVNGPCDASKSGTFSGTYYFKVRSRAWALDSYGNVIEDYNTYAQNDDYDTI